MSDRKRKEKKEEEPEVSVGVKQEKEKGLQEVENPYTVTNRAIDELVDPRDTMLYLNDSQIRLILTAFEFSRIPEYFGEEPVTELADFANQLKYYLVSKGGRGRRDILRTLRVTSGNVRENVNKSLFRQMLQGGNEEEEE